MTPVAAATPSRFAALEGYRAIACLMVLAYHCGVNLWRPPVALFGFCGVHLFFVLSGYLLFRPYAAAVVTGRPPPATGTFYLRRVLRIWPPFLVSLAAFTLMRVALRVNVPTVGNVAAHAALVFNFDPRINLFGINGVYWSLAIEAQFYLLLPVIGLAMIWVAGRAGAGRALAVVVMATLAVGVAARAAEVRLLGPHYAAIGNPDGVRFRSPLAYLDLFAFGMAVAAVQVSSGPAAARWARRPVRWGLAGGGLLLVVAANDWCAVAAGGGWQGASPFGFVVGFPVVLCGGIGLLLLGVVTHPAGGPAWLRWRPLVWVGERSYSLYLYHTGVQFFLLWLGLFRGWRYTPASLASAAVSLVPSLVVAAVMYRAVELPSLRWVARVRTTPGGVIVAQGGSVAAADPAVQTVSLLGP